MPSESSQKPGFKPIENVKVKYVCGPDGKIKKKVKRKSHLQLGDASKVEQVEGGLKRTEGENRQTGGKRAEGGGTEGKGKSKVERTEIEVEQATRDSPTLLKDADEIGESPRDTDDGNIFSDLSEYEMDETPSHIVKRQGSYFAAIGKSAAQQTTQRPSAIVEAVKLAENTGTVAPRELSQPKLRLADDDGYEQVIAGEGTYLSDDEATKRPKKRRR